MVHRLRRITADLDTKNIFVLGFYFIRALKLKPILLEIKPSNSKGYHYICWTRAYGTRDKLRAYIGDDVRRIRMDKKRKIGRQTLFKNKRKI